MCTKFGNNVGSRKPEKSMEPIFDAKSSGPVRGSENFLSGIYTLSMAAHTGSVLIMRTAIHGSDDAGTSSPLE